MSFLRATFLFFKEKLDDGNISEFCFLLFRTLSGNKLIYQQQKFIFKFPDESGLE